MTVWWKIALILFFLALIAGLSWQTLPGKNLREAARIPKSGVDKSVDPDDADVKTKGPAYLTSNLPINRLSDDALPVTSEGC